MSLKRKGNFFSRASSFWGQNPLCAVILTAPIAKIWTFCCLRDKQHKIKPVETLTSETLGTSFGCSDFWDFLGGYVLFMTGRWYSRQPLTNNKYRLSTQMIPKTVAPKFCTHSPLQFLERGIFVIVHAHGELTKWRRRRYRKQRENKNNDNRLGQLVTLLPLSSLWFR